MLLSLRKIEEFASPGLHFLSIENIVCVNVISSPIIPASPSLATGNRGIRHLKEDQRWKYKSFRKKQLFQFGYFNWAIIFADIVREVENLDGFNILGLVTVSIGFGVIINNMADAGKPLKDLCESLAEATLRLASFVIW
jgi:hypothetical protein